VTDDLRPFAAVVGLVEPGARLTGLWTFPGGLSAEMTVLEVDRANAGHRRLVVRRVRHGQAKWRSLSLADEHRLLLALRARGLPTPTPLLFDDSGAIFDHPYAVFDYVDGAPLVTTDDPVGTGRSFATQLAAVHGVAISEGGWPALPSRTAQISRKLAEEPEVLDAGMGEGFLRDFLRTRWPPPDPGRTVLLHGDFWAGNLLWRGNDIVAVIDWEEAATGDPLTDVATTRLDLLWAFGPPAMAAFTDRYLSVTAADPTRLPLWDLAAALRPAGAFSAWVADWAAFGRPDMNAPTMRAQHRWFTDQALRTLHESE